MSEATFIERFEAFARSKPANESYDAGDSYTCALAQFGFPGLRWSDVKAGVVPQEAYQAIFGRGTFGALADRLAETPKVPS